MTSDDTDTKNGEKNESKNSIQNDIKSDSVDKPESGVDVNSLASGFLHSCIQKVKDMTSGQGKRVITTKMEDAGSQTDPVAEEDCSELNNENRVRKLEEMKKGVNSQCLSKEDGVTVRVDPGQDSGATTTLCWPMEWLAEDFPRCRILAVHYDSHLSHWLPWCPYDSESRTLTARAKKLLHLLEAAKVGQGGRPVLFVAHSLGGLIVKEALVQCDDSTVEKPDHAGEVPVATAAPPDPEVEVIEEQRRYRALLARACKGVLFYSTPHRGTTHLDPPENRSLTTSLVLSPSTDLAQLAAGPRLERLNGDFQHAAIRQGFQCVSVNEVRETNLGYRRVPWYVHMVTPHSGHPGVGRVYFVDTNHIYVCKPSSRESPQYTILKELLQNILPKTYLQNIDIPEPDTVFYEFL